ncbi:MAG: cystathionine gamma-synthase family protein [Fervidicoccaceae archaeon]
MKKGTVSIHGHEYYDEGYGIRMPPVYLTSLFEQPNRKTGETKIIDGVRELKYSREENPTTRSLEKAIAKLEEGEDALAFNSGMGAISSVLLSRLSSESKVVIPMEAYSGTIALLVNLSKKIGFKLEKVWPSTEKIIEAIEKDADLAIVETITNPTLRVVDIGEIAKVSAEKGTFLIVDNTFASPILYTPLLHGASLVIESTTKYISGHNDVVGGVIAGKREDVLFLWEWRKLLGTIMQPFEAFLVLRGMKSFAVRMEAHSRNALAVAEFLSEHPRISEVYYPGLESNPYREIASRLFRKKMYGGVVSFKVKGGRDFALSVLRKLKIIIPSPSFGGPESLLTYPIISASKYIQEEDRRALGITEDLLRLSVGLEDVDDIIEDLDQALS